MNRYVLSGLVLTIGLAVVPAHAAIQSANKLVDSKQMVALHKHGLPLLVNGQHYTVKKTCTANEQPGVFLLAGIDGQHALSSIPDLKAWSTKDSGGKVTIHIKPSSVDGAKAIALPVVGCEAAFQIKQATPELIEVSGLSKPECLHLVDNLEHRTPGTRPLIYGGLCTDGNDNRVRFPGRLDGRQ